MDRYNHRFRLLYRLLDESGLEWLSDEVRSFAIAPPCYEVSEAQAAAMRRSLSRLDIQVTPQPDTQPIIRSDLVTEPKSFEECIQYLVKRIDNLTTYLESSVTLAMELGISNLQLGPEASGQADHMETVRQMGAISSTIREIVEIDL